VLDDIGFGITDVSEQVVVQKETTFVYTFLALSLAAHANDWLEFS